MINCTRIDARGRNKGNGNMFDYMLATERLSIDGAVAYYAGSGPDPRQTINWGGSLAAELGLEGQPSFDALTRQACSWASASARVAVTTLSTWNWKGRCQPPWRERCCFSRCCGFELWPM